MTLNIIKSVALLILTWLLYYAILPTIAIDSSVAILMGVAILTIAGVMVFTTRKGMNIPLLTTASVLFGVYAIIGFLTTAPVFNADRYQNMIGDIPTKEYNGDIQPIDPSNIIIIDETTARRLGDKKLANGDEIIGSQVEIGKYTLQEVGDQLYYVAPLLHSGLFKYMDNTDGTDGYIMVNATKSKDVKYVPDFKIQYQPQAFWSKDLKRHLRFNGYMFDYIGYKEFEIDDDGNPYWILSKYEKHVGLIGRNTESLVLVNATNGEIEEYDIDDVPSWVDRVHPDEFVETQLRDWGNYIHGWWNPSNKDEVKPTPGTSVVYGSDGECYYYTGITSVGKDGTILGFILTNTRDKSTTYYRMAGATETKAKNSAEGAVQEKGYVASNPRPYNINGELTYVMALKDAEGLIKNVGLVSVANYEIVAVGDNVREAIRAFKTRMNTFIGTDVLSSDVSYITYEGVVSRINQDAETGYYYILLEDGDKIISLTSEISEEVLLTEPKDVIVVRSFPSNTTIIDGVYFDNKSIELVMSNEQKELENEQESIVSSKIMDNINERVESEWKEFTTEQKDSILQSLKN